MSIDNISHDRTGNALPTGISEHIYATKAEMTAFIEGVKLADDIDVEVGQPFERDGQHVVRVAVGEWDADEINDDDPWDGLSLNLKLSVLSGKHGIASYVLAENEELVKMINCGDSEAECLDFINENF